MENPPFYHGNPAWGARQPPPQRNGTSTAARDGTLRTLRMVRTRRPRGAESERSALEVAEKGRKPWKTRRSMGKSWEHHETYWKVMRTYEKTTMENYFWNNAWTRKILERYLAICKAYRECMGSYHHPQMIEYHFFVSQTVWFMVSSPNSAQWAACTGEKFSPNCVNSVNFSAGNRPFPEQNWTLFGSSLLAVAAKDSNPCWLMVIWCCMRSPNGVNYTTQYAGDYISHCFCITTDWCCLSMSWNIFSTFAACSGFNTCFIPKHWKPVDRLFGPSLNKEIRRCPSSFAKLLKGDISN